MMLRATIGAACLLAATAPAAAEREPLGVYQGWGAFADAAPRRCFAIARPVRQRGRAFVAVARWPDSGARAQVHFRLSRARHPQAQVTLAVGDRRFRLIAGPDDAWAPDARADAAIVAAMRDARSMSVESVAARGGAFADTYALAGAATAIDAAVIACAAPRARGS